MGYGTDKKLCYFHTGKERTKINAHHRDGKDRQNSRVKYLKKTKLDMNKTIITS